MGFASTTTPSSRSAVCYSPVLLLTLLLLCLPQSLALVARSSDGGGGFAFCLGNPASQCFPSTTLTITPTDTPVSMQTTVTLPTDSLGVVSILVEVPEPTTVTDTPTDPPVTATSTSFEGPDFKGVVTVHVIVPQPVVRLEELVTVSPVVMVSGSSIWTETSTLAVNYITVD